MEKKVTFTTHPSSDRQKKNLLFLNLIRKSKSTSRTEISRLTGSNIVTVSNYINSYVKKRLVLEIGYEASSGGRRPELVELNKKWGYVIGIDITDGCINGILADFNAEVLAGEAIRNYKELKLSVATLLNKLLEISKIDKTLVKKIAVSIPSAGNIAEDTAELAVSIEKETQIPVLSGSAALCAAFGEKNLNPETTDASKVLFIYTSLGEGVFIAGEEFYEAGDKEKECAYLRPFARNLSIAEEAKRVVAEGVGTKIVDMVSGNTEKITLETVVNAAKEHDEVAADLLKNASTNLSVRAAYLINLFEPDVVIIGGGAEKSKDLFFNTLASNAKRLILQSALNRVKIAPAILGEEARVKGSAFLAIREAFIET